VNFLYSAFGLILHADRQIPGLAPFDAPVNSADVEIHFGALPGMGDGLPHDPEKLKYVSSYTTDSGDPVLKIWTVANGELLRWDYFDGAQFWLDPRGTAVWALWPGELSLEDVAAYLLGPVLGLVLRLRGITCLHASAVAFGNCAVAFAGSERAGKSTTAAALARRGHAVLSDDIVTLRESIGEFSVLPAYPYLCLWQQSVEMLYGPQKTLPSFSPNWDKRQLRLAENHLRFEELPLPLGAIFILGERSTDAAVPLVETLTPREGLLSLIANSYATNLLDQGMRAREFEVLGRVLAAVPVWRLRPHEDGSRIDQLCDVIERRCHDLRASHSPVSPPR